MHADRERDHIVQDDETIAPIANEVSMEQTTTSQHLYSPCDQGPNSLSDSDTLFSGSAPRSEDSHTAERLSIWRSWNTITLILGLYVLALLCAATHLCMFTYLDGRVFKVDYEYVTYKTTTIPQGYVTTISLVLVTAFRASLITSIGMCYTQHMWRTFRSKILAVEVIEDLFQLRVNAFRFLNFALFRYTPGLCIIAAISWLLPLVMIYPPGALIVGLDTRSNHEIFNVSMIQEQDNQNLTTTIRHYPNSTNVGFATLTSDDKCKGHFLYIKPTLTLQSLANSVLIVSEISHLDSPAPGNWSYSITFQGPAFQCQQMPPMTGFKHFTSNDFTPGQDKLQTPKELIKLSSLDGTITLERPFPDTIFSDPNPWNATCRPSKPVNSSGTIFGDFTLFWSYTIEECGLAVADYNVDITSLNGLQKIDYTIRNKQPFPNFNQSLGHCINTLVQPWPQYLNIWALGDSLLQNIQLYGGFLEGFDDEKEKSNAKLYRLPDGNDIEVCEIYPIFTELPGSSSPILALSKFNKNRSSYQGTLVHDELIFSEALLDEAVANITISSLALDTWYGPAKGSTSNMYNIYMFQHKFNFYLPYGLSLVLALPVLLIGFLALHSNGVSAIDGGFVQILMTTTGINKLREIASEGSPGGMENIPEELKKLKVRFGELLESAGDETTHRGAGDIDTNFDMTRRSGFGSLDETKPILRASKM